jgi:hypothetical protein
MNTVQNGKGDRARNNWGSEWYGGYEAINWHRPSPQRQAATGLEKRDARATLAAGARGSDKLSPTATAS